MDLYNITDYEYDYNYIDDDLNLHANTTSWQQYFVWFYLTIVGILGVYGNSLIIATFIKFQDLTTKCRPLLINLCVANLGICVLGLPFAAVSSFANRWLFGDGGCQYYALMGFLFGTAGIGTLTMLAVDLYLIIVGQNSNLSSTRYMKMLPAIWIFALFWSLAPLFGWGRYNLEPTGTTCTIDYMHNDLSYKTYIISYFVFSFILPLGVMAVCYFKASKYVSSRNEGPVTDEDNMITLCVLLVIGFVVFWSAYAVVCLWTVFGSPDTVPDVLALIPPLMAKDSTVVNPLLYVLVNRRLRRAAIAVALCKDLKPVHNFKEITEEMVMVIDTHIKAEDGGLVKVHLSDGADF